MQQRCSDNFKRLGCANQWLASTCTTVGAREGREKSAKRKDSRDVVAPTLVYVRAFMVPVHINGTARFVEKSGATVRNEECHGL